MMTTMMKATRRRQVRRSRKEMTTSPLAIKMMRMEMKMKMTMMITTIIATRRRQVRRPRKDMTSPPAIKAKLPRILPTW